MGITSGPPLAAAFMALLIGTSACFAQSSGMVLPNTPQAETAIRTLDNAAIIDRLNAGSYSGSATSEAGVYYYLKAREALHLANLLQSNQAVSNEDIAHALDSGQAVRYTSGF
jgi:hypothetical protein